MAALSTRNTLFDPAHLDDPQWAQAPLTQVTTLATPQGMQVSEYLLSTYRDGEWGRIPSIDIRGWQTRHSLTLLLEFDSTHGHTAFMGPDHFLDRVAVFFPADENAHFMTMGSPQSPGFIWSWRADGKTESMLAKGPGTLTPVSNEGLKSQSKHNGKRWRVQLSGPQIVNTPRRFAVAVWSGANRERAGLKAFSKEWIELAAL